MHRPIRDQIKGFCEELQFRPSGAQLDLLYWLSAPIGVKLATYTLKPLPRVTHESLLLLGRGSGKSTLSVITALRLCWAEPGTQVIIAADSLEKSDTVLMKYARDFAQLIEPFIAPRSHDFLRPGSVKRVLRFKNGSELRMLPNIDSAVRGYGPKLLVCDEVATWPTHSAEGRSVKSFLEGIRARMAGQHKDYRIVTLSTPRSASGWVWEMYNDPPENFACIRASTMEVRPLIKREQFKYLKEHEMKREIEAQFASTDDTPIDVELLDECEVYRDDLPPPNLSTVVATDPGFRSSQCGFTVASRRKDMIIVHELGRVKFKKNVSGFCDRVKSLSQKYKARVLLDQYSQDSLLLLLRQNGVQNVDVSPWSIRNRDGAFDTLHTLLEDKRILLPKEQTKVLREEISGLQTRWLSSGRRRIESGAAHNDCLFSLLLAVENLKKYIEPRITVVYSG